VLVPAGEVQIGDSVSLASASNDRFKTVTDVVPCKGITGECVKVFFAPGDYCVFNLAERVWIKR